MFENFTKNLILYFQLFFISTYQWLILCTLSPRFLFAVKAVFTQNSKSLFAVNYLYSKLSYYYLAEEINKTISFAYFFGWQQCTLIHVIMLYFLLTLIYSWTMFLLASWLEWVWQQNLMISHGTGTHSCVKTMKTQSKENHDNSY